MPNNFKLFIPIEGVVKRISEALFVEALGRRDVAVGPVDHDVRKEIVQSILTSQSTVGQLLERRVRPRRKLLQNVSRQSQRGVVQSES